MKRKIAIITGSRAEYGLLYWLMREIQNDTDLELQLIVTCMHLSPEFGLTYRFIEQDGFKIDAKVEMLMSSDTAIGTAKSIGLGVISFSDAFQQLKPDLIVLLGDRFESLAVAQAALVQKIPLAHIHGGELSLGAIDDAIRHSITKMAHLHFVAAEPYRQRVIQLGENPHTVYNVGAPGLERIKKMQLLTKAEWEKQFNFQLGHLNFLVTYLPVTLEMQQNQIALDALFAALDAFPEAKIIFTKANADEAGRYVNQRVDDYVAKNGQRSVAFVSMGDLNYLSLIPWMDVIIGNSSSGIIEIPYFCKPTVNIGTRQAKRLRATSIIDCKNESADIIAGINKALSPDFQESIKLLKSPYDQDNTAHKIKTILKNADLKQIIVKHFYDLENFATQTASAM